MSENLGTFGIPAPNLPLGTAPSRDGMLRPVAIDNMWYRFLARLSQLSAEKPIVDVTVGASPFTYTADTIGHLNIQGGTISTRTLTRGSKTINFTTSMVPVVAGDVVTITYSVVPTLSFVPGARA